MNDIAKALWKLVPNKGMVLYNIGVVCLIMTLAGGLVIYGAFNVEVRGSQTLFNVVHDHSKRTPVFNVKSIEANTGMIAILLDGQAVALSDLRTDLRSHNRLLYSPNVRDKTGKFVNKDVKR